MSGLGDFDASAVVYGKFTTFRPSTGAPFTLAGTPALSVYKDNSTTQSTTGVTLTVDFDSVTGLNHFAIDTSADGAFYSAGSFFDIVITAGTVDSVSVVGSVVASFTIGKAAVLRPTTAGRTLDVTATGAAGIDWGNVENPTTTINFSGTTIKTATDVETDTADIQTRLPAALVSGRIDASVGAMAANVITAAATAADFTTEIQTGLATAAALATVDTVVDSILVDTTAMKGATFDTSTDSLEAIRNRGDAAWVTATGFSTLDAAGVRTAVGLASANLDTQLAAIDTDTGNILTNLATVDGVVDAILVDTAEIGAAGAGLTALPWNSAWDTEVQSEAQDAITASLGAIADAVHDETVDGSYTFRQSTRLQNSAMAAKLSGAATTSVVIRDISDSKDRITATVDADGNRTALTLDAT